jgi:outer membrane immunogenic protein
LFLDNSERPASRRPFCFGIIREDLRWVPPFLLKFPLKPWRIVISPPLWPLGDGFALQLALLERSRHWIRRTVKETMERIMKTILLAALPMLALGAEAPAGAADLPARVYTKSPAVPPSPLYDWSGFYIGINGGGGSAHECWDILSNGPLPVVPSAREGCHDATGGTVGGQVGYRWQATNWVFGLEAQGNWANFTGSNNNGFFPGQIINNTRIDAFGLFTGQAGYAFNNVLLYVKGGAAVVSDKYSTSLTAAFAAGLVPPAVGGQVFATSSEARWGGTAGVGLEFGFARNWSVGVEYDHLFAGGRDVQLNLIPPFGTTISTRHHIREDVDIGLVRVNYTFGGPVVSRY